jgi:hypothetical protein
MIPKKPALGLDPRVCSGLRKRSCSNKATISQAALRNSSAAALAINKPFECRSAVALSPSFRPMLEGYIRQPMFRRRGHRFADESMRH